MNADDDRDQRRSQNLLPRRRGASKQRDHDQDERNGERHVGHRSQSLVPEMRGASLGRAEAAHARERSAVLVIAASNRKVADHAEQTVKCRPTAVASDSPRARSG